MDGDLFFLCVWIVWWQQVSPGGDEVGAEVLLLGNVWSADRSTGLTGNLSGPLDQNLHATVFQVTPMHSTAREHWPTERLLQVTWVPNENNLEATFICAASDHDI